MTPLSDRALDRLRAGAADAGTADARYHLLEVLGEGGMGTVYRGRDALLQRDVAVKVAHAPAGVTATAFAERLRNESRVLARLEHPGIVPVHDAGVLADGRVFYVMKLVHGQTLAATIEAEPHLDRRLAILERVAEAVAFAHQHGVVHRDLKPENVMVGDFGEVLVMDWGVAKAVGSGDPGPGPTARVVAGGTDPGTVLGTPGYMSPEQAAAGPVDARTDIHALGALLAFLATGRQPSAITAPRELLAADRTVPPRLRAIALRCLAPAPEARYHSAAEVAEELRQLRLGGRVEAYREGVVERLTRWVRSYRTPILLILAYLLMRVAVAWLGR